jgi:hypothetical protein
MARLSVSDVIKYGFLLGIGLALSQVAVALVVEKVVRRA